jgi:phosphohistidine phosphatase
VGTLYILRHATAAATGTNGGDASRPLTEGGLREAESMGRFLQRAGIAPDMVACSSALRALQTAEALLRGLQSKRRAEANDALYNASGSALLEWVQKRPDSERSVLLVAHMPGVGELASLLTTEHDDLALTFAPATLAAVTSEEKLWADWDFGRGLLTMHVPVSATDR